MEGINWYWYYDRNCCQTYTMIWSWLGMFCLPT